MRSTQLSITFNKTETKEQAWKQVGYNQQHCNG